MRSELDNQEIPRYLQVYNYYKELILSEKIVPETKLPSIRKGASQLQISRTTMESAYLLLAAEGYIMSRPQSGYYVTDIARKQNLAAEEKRKHRYKKDDEIIYDFVSSGVDKESFHFELWRRYMKSALRQDERLLSYGEPQGELEFREVLCKYLQQKRGVICTADQIVIGAGVQSLLHILCPMLKERNGITFYNSEYKQGISIFEDYGFDIEYKNCLKQNGIYYITPSQMTKDGKVMSIQERLALISAVVENNVLLIEDDYNHEFGYFQKPSPSIQGLAAGKNVVYLGSFSKMLLPSIRMSFMVLPPELMKKYEKKKVFYNQTASKAEQIALTQFIRDGHLESQIRKSRKIHMSKARDLSQAISEIWGEDGIVNQEESGFHVYLKVKSNKTAEKIANEAKKEKIAVIPMGETEGEVQLGLSTANVSVEFYKEVLTILKNLIYEEKG